jgi:hypothetical protein
MHRWSNVAALREHLYSERRLRVAPDDSQPTMTATPSLQRAEQREPIIYSRLLITIALALYGIPLMRHPEAGSLLDGVDLAIHETGHLVFAPFGDVIQFAGGTLFQLIVPTVFVVYFARRGDRHAATVPLWWIAQNLWNISVYVRDARTQELPLVGGGEHDWAFLLGHFGVLAHDQGIGQSFQALGMLLWLVAVVSGLVFALSAAPAPVSISPES